MKQTDLAEKAGVSATYISLLERNSREASVGLLKKLADALRIPLPVLLMMAEQISEPDNQTKRARGIVLEELLRLLDREDT